MACDGRCCTSAAANGRWQRKFSCGDEDHRSNAQNNRGGRMAASPLEAVVKTLTGDAPPSRCSDACANLLLACWCLCATIVKALVRVSLPLDLPTKGCLFSGAAKTKRGEQELLPPQLNQRRTHCASKTRDTIHTNAIIRSSGGVGMDFEKPGATKRLSARQSEAGGGGRPAGAPSCRGPR
jgi:hypothetical protein